MLPKIYTEDEHGIKQESIDHNALEVIFHLKKEGHSAFLVGGGVRDLLMDIKPKDFDISTSAKPEEIKQLFGKKCLLIGKRFRLAHLRFGPKALEVSTFRSGDLSGSSLIVRDNAWGTAEEDVLRRDFTINALFYDPTTRTILDYVGGYLDSKNKLLRSIGNPLLRFKQDPVRMIRLLKFRARFNFNVEPKTEKALFDCKEEISKSAPARVLEEIFKMLESGFSSPFFDLMEQTGFLEILFPCFHHFFHGPNRQLAYKYLKVVDSYHVKGSQVLDRAFLLATLVFPILEQELLTLTEDRQTDIVFNDIIHLSTSLLQGIDTSSFAHFPKKILAVTNHILTTQFRLTPIKKNPKYHAKLSHVREFQMALQFLNLRSAIKPSLKSIYTEWKNAQIPSK